MKTSISGEFRVSFSKRAGGPFLSKVGLTLFEAQESVLWALFLMDWNSSNGLGLSLFVEPVITRQHSRQQQRKKQEENSAGASSSCRARCTSSLIGALPVIAWSDVAALARSAKRVEQ